MTLNNFIKALHADSVFRYYKNVEYGMRVLQKMWEKTNKIVVITEIHDEEKGRTFKFLQTMCRKLR